jgi:hypothetical protein
MVSVGMDLTFLYFKYRAARAHSDSATFDPPGDLRVSGGRVLVEATATEDAEALRAQLEQLGLQGGATAAPLVSGRLPIEVLPEAARLESLRGMRPSRPTTRSTGSGGG